MRHLEESGGLRRIGGGVNGSTLRRALDRQPRPPEHEQIEVELARPPASTLTPPELRLERLELDQQGERTGLGIGPGRNVERGRGVAELRLIGDPDGIGRVQPRHAAKSDPGQRREGCNGLGQGRGRIPKVGTQADIGADSTIGHGHSIGALAQAAPYHRPMNPVAVAVLHPLPGPEAGPLTRATADARAMCAERHVHGFLAAGATSASIVAGPPDERTFGARLRELAAGAAGGGLIVLGSGAIPLARAGDRRAFVEAAAADEPRALANNRYSADIVAVARARDVLHDVPDLRTDNALPRWLAEVAGIPVDDFGRRSRLGIDIDGPLDLVLLGEPWLATLTDADTRLARTTLERVRGVTTDRGAELVVTGRLSAATLARLERNTASRTRALVEERGLRTAGPGQRPAASVLGALLHADGPGSLGTHLARLGEAAIVDSRVLLAHRYGADERGWPVMEDRFASDLLLHERIQDPWLRDLTRAAAEAPIPILLGGHTLVGPGLRLALRRRV